MITDEQVNGTDDNYSQEYNNLSTCYGADIYKFRALKKDVFDFAAKCNNKFQFENTKIKNIRGIYTDTLSLGYRELKIVPYIVRPVVRPAIQSISNIPSPLPIRRVKGGYSMNIDVKTYSEEYEIKSLSLVLKNDTLTKEWGELEPNDTDNRGKWDLHIGRDNLSDGDTIILEMEVKYNDGIYNSMLMSPRQAQYREGLTLRLKYNAEQEAKILGFIPMCDFLWWFWPNNAQSIVILWDLIILLIIIGIAVYLFYRWFVRINTYVPSNKALKIKKTK